MPTPLRQRPKIATKGKRPPARTATKAKVKPTPKPRPKKVLKPAIRIFVSYSHKDAGAQEQLQTHLATLMRDGVSIWFDGNLDAGDALDPAIARELRRAHIFVALLSPDYLASNYCWNIEYKRAMNRRARGTMRVIAAVVRSCAWKTTSAAGFKLLPKDGRPVTRWRSADDAFLDIAEGIRGTVKALRQELAAAPIRKPPRKAVTPAKKPKAAPRKNPTRSKPKTTRPQKKVRQNR